MTSEDVLDLRTQRDPRVVIEELSPSGTGRGGPSGERSRTFETVFIRSAGVPSKITDGLRVPSGRK